MSPLLARNASPVVEEMLSFFPGVIIEGARQVGKSTLAQQLADPDAVYVTLDNEAVRSAAAMDPDGFATQAGERQLIIDEIQRLPRLTLAVKAAIDANRRPGRFILTGSSSLLRVHGTADSLAGRVGRLTMYGLSQGEIRSTTDDLVPRIIADHADIPSLTTAVTREAYARLLAVGGYPEIRDSTDRQRNLWIDGYLRGVTGRDMAELNRQLEPARVESVLRVLAGQPAAELVKARLAQDTSVPTSTITGYLDLLHDVGLVTSIPPWTPNLSKREIGRPKTFVTDPALGMRLSLTTPEQLNDIRYSEAYGSFLEAFVVSELLKQRVWSQADYRVFHYRDRTEGEVDAIIELSDGRVIGIEVKASRSFSARQFATLTRLRDRLGEKFIAGIVINTSPQGYRYADRLYGAPVSALWEFN
ncbi:ATP-binding protein [uncultured Corynebacterium sp.]|uniref:ATP-binding protein n=1 Tax=uncultured Corynebacterium sp. TaxID=159447 RepID=UPI0025D4C7EE|nr:ATP-binding protein [uncultured Corynebacterium sp.]